MTAYFIRKPNCETVQVDNEWVILNPETYTVTKLNEAGGRCWSLLSEKQSAGEIVAALQSGDQDDAGQLKEDVELFLNSMLEYGLVDNAG